VASHFDHPWHYHPEVELTWIVRGEGQRHAGDSVEPFEAGDLCLMGSNLAHCWLSPKNRSGLENEAVVLQFHPDWIDSLSHISPELFVLKKIKKLSNHGLQLTGSTRDTISNLLEKILQQPTGSPVRIILCLEVLVQITLSEAGLRRLSVNPPNPPQSMRVSRRLAPIMQLIDQNYTDELHQAELAARCGITPAAFSRLFRKSTGQTYSEYISRLRIRHVCRLLRIRDITISEAAFESGFNDLPNFNRTFRRLMETTPGDYRRRFGVE
jgi:AraC-like DNA-binding protein